MGSAVLELGTGLSLLPEGLLAGGAARLGHSRLFLVRMLPNPGMGHFALVGRKARALGPEEVSALWRAGSIPEPGNKALPSSLRCSWEGQSSFHSPWGKSGLSLGVSSFVPIQRRNSFSPAWAFSGLSQL